jgi:hypothetical protein
MLSKIERYSEVELTRYILTNYGRIIVMYSRFCQQQLGWRSRDYLLWCHIPVRVLLTRKMETATPEPVDFWRIYFRILANSR